MRIATKTLASLLLATAVAVAVPGIGMGTRSKRRQESQFDRLLQRHDRKGDIRAEILGVEPLVFRDTLKKHSFDEIIRRHGFRNPRAFRLALLGKLKNELHQRGWTTRKIDHYMMTRRDRLS